MKGLETVELRMPGRINGILLALYCFCVFVTEIVIRDLFHGKKLIILLPIMFAAFIALCPYVLKQVNKLEIHLNTEKAKEHNIVVLIKILMFIIPLTVLLLYYFAYYPGLFSYDSFFQYNQAISNQYSDWHPVIHTLIVFKLPLSLTGGWIGSIILFQDLCFSVVLGYSFVTIYKFTNLKISVALMTYILLNPLLGYLATFPWKDTTFAIAALLLLIYSFQIYLTKGDWLKPVFNTVMYILTVTVTTLSRHNALLFTIPIVLAVFFCISRKRTAVICFGVIILCFGVKYPLYYAIGVEKPSNRQVETLGLPMTVIGAAVTYTPELLDKETLEFAYKIAPEEVWKAKYITGSYQQVKFDARTNTDVIEDYGRQKVISMMFRCFRYSPKESSKALIKLTEASYTITDEYNSTLIYGLDQPESGNVGIQTLLKEYCRLMTYCFPFLYIRIGVILLLLIISVLSKCRLNKLEDWKKILFVLPVFFYNYGTSMLMAGNELSTRFFFYTYLVVPILLIFMFIKAGSDCSPNPDYS